MMTRTHLSCITLVLTFIFSIQGNSQSNKLLNDSMPQTWKYISEFSQTLPSEDKWWKTFDDSTLDTLIDMAIKENDNMLVALKRIELAKSAVKIAQSGYYPTISMNAGWSRERTSGVTDNYFDLGLNFNWQIDLFGQITSQVKAKKALLNATKNQYYGAMVTLCANVATAYVNLRTWQAQYLVATTHMESQKQVLEMTEARFKSGLASMLDVSQAKTVYLSTLASIAPLSANIEAQINSIAILLGVYSDKLPHGLQEFVSLPSSYILIPVGVPTDMLRRRPDIMEAENNVAAYAASIGIAKKDFLPTLSLNGNIGFKSGKLDDLFKDNSFNYTIAPTLSWAIFDGFSRKYNLIEAKEQYIIAIDEYNSTVLTAVKEVQNAMISYRYMLIEVQELEKVTNEALNSLKLSIDLYKRGLSSFNNVLTSQQTYLQYNNSLVSAKGKTLLAAISIYQALGGGWESYIE